MELAPHEELTRLITGYSITQALYVAAKLDIAELLVKSDTNHVDDLAQKAGADSDALYRIMRALATVGVFKEREKKVFIMTPKSECLRYGHPHSVKAMVLSMGEVFYPVYQKLIYSAKHGANGFEAFFGMPVFEYFDQHQEQARVFDRMMTEFHGGETLPMVSNYDFSQFETVVDVGGGNGEVLYQVLKKNPEVKGILYDLPHVIKRSAENMKNWGVSARVECTGGNFFHQVPEGGDAYILRHIIHDWNDRDAVKILGNCCRAMKPDGKVLIVEAVIPEDNSPHPYKWLDLTMLLIGGKERTRKQYEVLLEKSCLQLDQVIRVTDAVSLIEATRKPS